MKKYPRQHENYSSEITVFFRFISLVTPVYHSFSSPASSAREFIRQILKKLRSEEEYYEYRFSYSVHFRKVKGDDFHQISSSYLHSHKDQVVTFHYYITGSDGILRGCIFGLFDGEILFPPLQECILLTKTLL